MLNRIITSLSFSTSNIIIPEYEYLSNQLEVNRNNLLGWRRSRISSISTDSPLYSLILSMPKNRDTENSSIVNSYAFDLLKKSNYYGISTVYGTVNPVDNGVFSGRCREQWIGILDESPLRTKNEKDLKPIRCIWHPFDSLNFWLDEDSSITSSDISFFTLNTKELFRLVNFHYRRYLNSDSVFNVKKFIEDHIYSTIINDIVDITLFNWFSNINYGLRDIDESSRKTPTWIDLKKEVNEYYVTIADELNLYSGGMNQISQNIRLSSDKSVLDFLMSLPIMPTTTDLINLYLIAISKYLNPMLDLNRSIHGIVDKTLNNFLKFQLNILENNKINLPSDVTLREMRKKQFSELKGLIS